MDTSKVPLVICLTLVIVIGVNAALLAAFRRGKEASQIDLFRNAVHRARRPWADEDDNLQELSRRVRELNAGRTGDQSQEDKDRQES